MSRRLVDVLAPHVSWAQVKAGAIAPARGAHVATRAQIEAEGDELVATLYALFDSYNEKHFAGALAAPLVVATLTSPRAFADASERDVNGLRSIIRIHPSTLRKGETFIADVLLHEMIHVWQFEVQRDREDGYRGHGPQFADKCNELGRALGLPPVSAKGRKGLPDCASWPLCVRPSGYYGTPVAEHEREKRSKKREPKPKPGDAGELLEDLVDEDLGRGLSTFDRASLQLVRALAISAAHVSDDGRRAQSLLRGAELLARFAPPTLDAGNVAEDT